MKTKLLLTALLSFIFCLLSSQVPQGFNYQAIVRNTSGDVLQSKNVKVKVAIHTTPTGGTPLWDEEHALTTSQFGLVTFVVGTGPNLSGSVTNFSNIHWAAQTLYLRTYVQYPVGDTYTEMGTTQIWSVPYSLMAKDIVRPIDSLTIKSKSADLNDAIFEVKNKSGQTVFAVYNEGVRVYVSDGKTKGLKGGFAVGGFGTDTKSESTKYLFVDKDSVRIYLDTNPLTKGNKGTFAVGGYDLTKGPGSVQEYLNVNPDSTRIYVKGGGKGLKGGFAVGGYTGKKGGDIETFTSLTPNNYLIGYQSGYKINTGKYNSIFGYNAGQNLTDGSSNIFIGYKAGLANTVGGSNIFIGNSSGISNLNGTSNIFLGDFSGQSNLGGLYSWMGSNNIFVGQSSGVNNTAGGSNIFIGTSSGMANVDGNMNIYIGERSGMNLKGIRNTYIGTSTGEHSTSGDDNILIGPQTGQFSSTGNSNTIIGSNAGWVIGTGSNNTFFGAHAGENIVNGSYNVLVGSNTAGAATGNRNVKIGYQAGGYNGVEGNVLIGYQAGMNETNSNRLYIENISSGPESALIYGEFDNDILAFNAKVGIGMYSPSHTLDVTGDLQTTSGAYFATASGIVGIGTASPTEMLDVNGNARFRTVSSGVYAFALSVTNDGTLTTSTSDISMKKNIEPISSALVKVLEMNGVYFSWRNDNLDNRRVGFVAQEIEKILPEVVFTNPVDGLKGINYPEITAVLAQAIKEQQQQIESYKSQLQSLQEKVDKIEALLVTSGGK